MIAAADLVAHLAANGLRVTTAESCTGGLVAAALTDVAGSSAAFEQGVVTYSNGAKIRLLGVLHGTLEIHGAVSEEVAREMAQGALVSSGADIAVSVTGIAGPGGSEFKPEGRVCFATATRTSLFSETKEFGAIGRANVRQAAKEHALALIAQASGASA